MTTAPLPSSFTVRRPAGQLARYVSQYWLSLNNTSPVYAALPDGCLDLVLEVTASGYRSWIYGSTTRPTAIPCTAGTHYLGIRFHPGRSRHFIAAAADEITDCREDLQALMRFPAERVAAHITAKALFDELDEILVEALRRAPPFESYIDGVVQHIHAHHGVARIDDVAVRSQTDLHADPRSQPKENCTCRTPTKRSWRKLTPPSPTVTSKVSLRCAPRIPYGRSRVTGRSEGKQLFVSGWKAHTRNRQSLKFIA